MKPPYEAMQLNGNVCTSLKKRKKKSFHISDVRLILQLSRGDPVCVCVCGGGGGIEVGGGGREGDYIPIGTLSPPD